MAHTFSFDLSLTHCFYYTVYFKHHYQHVKKAMFVTMNVSDKLKQPAPLEVEGNYFLSLTYNSNNALL